MPRSNLLINEPPLLILPLLATTIGLNEAIALQQLHYWLQNQKVGVMRDGFKWIYNTYGDWRKGSFPFWSPSTIERTFRSLEKLGLVISMQYDAKRCNQRKYYRINYQALENLEKTMSSTDDPSNGRSEGMIDDVNLMGSSASDRGTDDVKMTSSLNTETTRNQYMDADASARATPFDPETGSDDRSKVDVFARIENYPKNTREATRLVYEIFGFFPPKRPAAGEEPGEYGGWDKNIKQLITICKEYDTPLEIALKRTRTSIEQIRRTKIITIHRPGSLIAFMRSELASGGNKNISLKGNVEIL